MDERQHQQIVSFLFSIANDILVHECEPADYKKFILPFIVIRRFDAVLEPTKEKVLETKRLYENKFKAKALEPLLCKAAGEAFYNVSQYCLRDMKSFTSKKTLEQAFGAYIKGFSNNVQEILDNLDFWHTAEFLIEKNLLGGIIEKILSTNINLSPRPVLNDDGSERLPALDNHSMGTVFEHLLRRFNESFNPEGAGLQFTPRDVVALMTDLAFSPIQDKLTDSTYLVYDGACGTGGILSEAADRVKWHAAMSRKNIRLHLYGQELRGDTYAIACADMLMKFEGIEEGKQAENIKNGSTISGDAFPREKFDFMISNPPFGTPWKKDLEKLGLNKKDEFKDSRFVVNYDGNPEFSFIPNIGDPQMLFLANNISKMKKGTEIGSRIVEVHNGSSLFTGNAGQGESNLRRYIIESDILEAIVALPENLFYNTGIGTFLWILSNNKPTNRKGKIQLIDATSLKTTLRKNLGKKNCELDSDTRAKIVELFLDFQEANPEYSKVFDNCEFGYYQITVCYPAYDENGSIIIESKGKRKGQPVIDKTETEKVPLSYNNGVEPINAFFKEEIKPFALDAWVDYEKTLVGYELSFTKYFYKPVELRPINDIIADIINLEKETDGLLKAILEE